MPYSDPARQKQAQHESYLRNKEKVRLASEKQRLERKKKIHKLKQKPCFDCGGEFPPYVMDFHHKNPQDKVLNVARLVITKAWQAVLDEIEKCDLLCANCHRIRTHEEKHISLYEN